MLFMELAENYFLGLKLRVSHEATIHAAYKNYTKMIEFNKTHIVILFFYTLV